MGVGMRKDGAKPSVSTCITGGVRAGVHSHHFLMSSVLQKLAPVLGNLGWISVKSPLVETGLSLRAGHAVQRNRLQGNKIFPQPRAGSLPPCPSPDQHIIEPPQYQNPQEAVTHTGTALEQSPGLLPREAEKPKRPASKRDSVAGTQNLSSVSQRGRGDTAEPLHPPLCPVLSYPCCL